MTHHQCDCNQEKMERLVEERDEWKRDALSADAQAQAAWEKQKELEARVGELEGVLREVDDSLSGQIAVMYQRHLHLVPEDGLGEEVLRDKVRAALPDTREEGK